MSHLTASKVIITDLEILKKAVEAFGGLKWMDKTAKFRSYYGGDQLKQQIDGIGTLEAVIKVEKGCYDIGVIKPHDGEGWVLSFDHYDYSSSAIVGSSCEKVINAYSEAFIRDFAERNGFMTTQSVDSDGNIQLTLEQ